MPYFPGWRATAGAKSLPLLRVDHALMGVVIPKGESEVVLQFRSNYFVAGAALSLLGLFVVSAGFGAFVWRSSGFAGRLSSRPRLFRF